MLRIYRSENVGQGRETHTYLSYILEHYHKLPEWIVFTQGYPRYHTPRWTEVFRAFIDLALGIISEDQDEDTT